MTAQAKESGQIRLTWQKPADFTVKGYNLYRSASSFTTIGDAAKVNAKLITLSSYLDLPVSDGLWYYRVTCVNNIGNESDPSAEASAVSDSVLPRALSIVYAPQGNVDPVTGAMSQGRVDVTVTVSETLQAVPFLTVTPEEGTPMGVTLIKSGDLQYTGRFDIVESAGLGNLDRCISDETALQ